MGAGLICAIRIAPDFVCACTGPGYPVTVWQISLLAPRSRSNLLKSSVDSLPDEYRSARSAATLRLTTSRICGMVGGSATVLAPSPALSLAFCALLVLPASLLSLASRRCKQVLRNSRLLLFCRDGRLLESCPSRDYGFRPVEPYEWRSSACDAGYESRVGGSSGRAAQIRSVPLTFGSRLAQRRDCRS